ncbi:MAG: transglutaminase domain-containing protein [Lachnospiraceae bacterium]
MTNRRYRHHRLLTLVLLVSLAGSLFLSGCGSSGEIGGYRIPVLSDLISQMAVEDTDESGKDKNSAGDSTDDENSKDKAGSDEGNDSDGRKTSKKKKPNDYGLADPEGYLYLKLDKEEKAVYDQILKACFAFGDEVKLDTRDEDLIEKIYYYVVADHPDIFWTEGYKISKISLAGQIISISFVPKFSMSKEEAADWKKTINSKVKKIFKKQKEAGIPTSSGSDQDHNSKDKITDYDRIKYAFDYIVLHTDYEAGAEHNQNICSVFGKGRSVCQGYSAALQYLLQRQGMQAVTVNGEILEDGSSHAWNYVKADGKWYQLDITWGDPAFSEDSSAGKIPKNLVVYTHFCVTDEEISKTHRLNSIFSMPKCKASADNYYVHEGQYFKEKNDNRVAKAIKKSLNEKRSWVSMRYADKRLYKSELKRLIKQGEIFNIMQKAGVDRNVSSITYIDNSQSLTITVMWNQ